MRSSWSRARGVLLVAAALAACPAAARAQTWSAASDQRFFGQSVPRSVFLSQLRYPGVADDTVTDRWAAQLRLRGGVRGRPTDGLTLVAELDTGLLELANDGTRLDGRPVGDQVQRTLLLGPVYAELQLGETGVVLARLGKMRTRVGEGALFSAYALGLLIDVDLGLAWPSHPWQLRAQALFPSGELVKGTFTSPLFTTELAYRFSRRTQVRLHGAAYLDRGGLGPVVADAGTRGRAARIEAAFAARNLPPEGVVCDPSDDVGRREFGELVACVRDALVIGTNGGTFAYDAETRGTLGWTGISAEAGGARWQASALFLYGFGAVQAQLHANGTLRQEAEARQGEVQSSSGPLTRIIAERAAAALTDVLDPSGRVQLGAWLAQATGRVSLTDDLRLDAFVLALSGDEGLGDLSQGAQRYGAFVSLAPFLPHTSLFFNGGAASMVSSPVVTALAPDAAGLVSGGLGAELFLGEALRVRGVVAAMGSLVANAAGASFEGVEVDLSADYVATEWLLVVVDGALLVPGPYFGDVPLGYQLIAGAAVSL